MQKKQYTRIPTLDLEPYLEGEEGEEGALNALANEVRQIQETIGFWCVINHGLSWELLEKTYEQLKLFFALPYKTKLKYRINHLSVGYVPPKSTKYITSIINENTKKDLNETLITALERPDDHELIRKGTRFVGPNQWPSELSDFRSTLVEYQREILNLGRRILPIFAVALELPRNYFDQFFADPVMWTRNTHYPPEKPEDNQYGIAPHSDHSFLTMLPMTEVPGLQILTQDKKWIEAEYVSRGILINTGEFLNRWTNGRFIPTPHRVISPDTDRYSIATFFNPSPETISETLVTCYNEKNPVRYEPMSLMEYLTWYIDTNYQRDGGGTQNS